MQQGIIIKQKGITINNIQQNNKKMVSPTEPPPTLVDSCNLTSWRTEGIVGGPFGHKSWVCWGVGYTHTQEVDICVLVVDRPHMYH